MTDAETARARWTAEKKLRNGLNLDPDMRDTLKDELRGEDRRPKGIALRFPAPETNDASD